MIEWFAIPIPTSGVNNSHGKMIACGLSTSIFIYLVFGRRIHTSALQVPSRLE